jgi:general secretion pathway protein D
MIKRLFLCCLAAGALLSAGCAQMARDHALSELREGEYELAIKDLEAGVERYPDSVVLRSSLITVKAEAVSRWIAEATRLRTAGKWDESEKVLRRALKAEPTNERLASLLEDLAADRRMAQKIDAARKLADSGKKAQALQLMEGALREAPHHAAVAAYKRQLEAELRTDNGGTGRVRLAEARPITLDFRGASLGTVLEAITRGSGVNFILDRDVRQDARVTVFLRSATVEDALDLITGANQLARRIIDPRTVLIYPNTPEKQKEHQELVVRVFHLANADAKSTAQLLRTMLHLKDPFVDERANMIAIRESPDVVAMAERLVALHDAGEAEVMLEVEVLEIQANRLTDLGITVPNSVTLTPLAAAGDAAGLTVQSLRGLNSNRVGVTVGNVVLNLRREVGDVNILANPRIRVKNREKARVVIGDRFPVVTSTATATGFVSESVSYLDVGLKLDVEPTVSLEDDVTIKLGLEVSSIAGSVRTPGGSLAYQVGTRNANTILRLRDGETQVLAGLISNDDRTSASRIPGLGDLPIAGRLFSSQKDELQRTELVLAITPRVLRSAPRPDASQAEMWIGTDNVPRLREPPKTLAAGQPPPAAPAGTAAAAPSSAPAGSPLQAAAPDANPAPKPAPLEPVQLVWKGPLQVKAGEIFTVPIHLVSSAPLRGAALELTFPPQQLEVVEVSEGGYFKQADGKTSFTQSVNAAEGKIGLGILRSDLTGASGDAPLIELRLRAKTAGEFDFKVSSLRPVGIGGVVPPGRLSTFHVIAK